MKRYFLLISALLIVGAAEAQVCKQESFDNPGPAMLYGLDEIRNNRHTGTCSYPVNWQSGSQWCVEHVADGGNEGAGDGAAHIISRGGESQFNQGWGWGNGCGTWNVGDTLRIKLRIKFDQYYLFNQDQSNKFMIWGTGGDRQMLSIRDGYWTAGGCWAYGAGSSDKCSNDGSACNSHSDCVDGRGVQYRCVPEGSFTNKGSFSLTDNVGAPCAGPTDTTDVGGMQINEWIYLQAEVKTGPQGYYKLWVNNNNEAEPNSCTGSASECAGSATYDYLAGRNPVTTTTVEAWEGAQTIGDFVTEPLSRDMGFYLDDMVWERNGSFDANWYTGSGGGGTPACSDGVDNDGDGLTDFQASGGDPGCSSADDTSENNCGNGVIDGTETCDGSQLGGATCLTEGFDSGTLGCAATCNVYDTTACAGSSGGGSVTPMFTSDFETGDFSEWDGVREFQPGHFQVLQDASCPTGSYCARATLTEGTTSDNYTDHYFGDHPSVGGDRVDEVWLKYWVKFEPGYVWPQSGQKTALLNATDGVSTQRRYQVMPYVSSTGTWFVQHSYIDDWRFFDKAQNVGTPVQVAMGQWMKIKLYTRMNTPGVSNGIIRLWIDDVLKMDYDNVNLRENTSYGFGKLIMGTYATPGSGSDGFEWFDGWVMSSADPDGSAPGSPPGTVTGAGRTDVLPEGN